jgi:GTP-binding protein
MVNNSPLAGQDGTKLTAQVIKDYLIAEAENDVALRFVLKENRMVLFGRGDLHLGVLLERMRRYHSYLFKRWI